MTYDQIKQEIANVSTEKGTAKREIDTAQSRINEYSDLQKYILENVGYSYTTNFWKEGSKNPIKVFVLAKSEPDVVEKNYSVIKRNYQGSYSDNDKANLLLRLKKVGNSNKYKWYEIDEILNDDGLGRFLKSQIPIIEQQKTVSENKYQELDRKLSQLKEQLANAENPNVAIYKDELMMLKEAEKSAISQAHKDKINSLIYRIEENGRFDYDSMATAWYMGAKQYVTNIVKKLGGKKYHKSEKNVSGSVYYNLPNMESVRISDHELPETETRIANRQAGWAGKWIEIVLDTPKPFSELKKEVLETIAEQIGYDDKDYNAKETQEVKVKIEKMLSEKEFGGIMEGVKHSSLGSSKELSISPIIKEHDMIAECGDCGDKFSYQNSKKHILWECPECKSIKRIS